MPPPLIGTEGIEQSGCPYAFICESVLSHFYLLKNGAILMKHITITLYQVDMTQMTLK